MTTEPSDAIGPTSRREAAQSTLNPRQKLEVFFDCGWSGTTNPAWPPTGQRLTPRQALARYEMYQYAGRTWIALKAVARDGTVFDVTGLCHAVRSFRSRR